LSNPAADPAADPAARAVAAAWIRNNVLAAAISGVASFVLYVLRQATGVAAADAGFVATFIMYVVAVALWTLYGAANGVLTGAVLQRIVPHLPVWAWIALHIAGAVLIGLAAEVSQVNSVRDTSTAQNETLAATLMLGAIAGAILGAVTGGFEALVLRRAATGTASWIAWSAIATAAGWCFLSIGIKLFDIGGDLTGEIASEFLSFLASVVMAVLTLPALRQLKPTTLSSAPTFFT
jgi:hypothetical protein